MHKIAFDVMGSDNGPIVAIKAAFEFIQQKNNIYFIFVGDKNKIDETTNKLNFPKERFEIYPTTQIIDQKGGIMDIRRKPDSSLVRAIELVKEKKADAMLTAGATAPFIASSHLLLGEFNGIARPGFMPTFPTPVKNKGMLILDVGANSENTPIDLHGYAVMASIYSKNVLGVPEPSVGLLNIGTEDSKGNDLQRKAFELLKQDEKINFVGNVEARDIINGVVDIMVVDGFSGNHILKAMEGTAKTIMSELKKELTSTLYRKIIALFLKPAFNGLKERFDYRNYAGAILLGIDGLVFKSHGSSDVKAWKGTMRIVGEALDNDVLTKMKRGMAI